MALVQVMLLKASCVGLGLLDICRSGEGCDGRVSITSLHQPALHTCTYKHAHQTPTDTHLEEVDGGLRDLLVLDEGGGRVVADGLAVRVGRVLPAADEGCGCIRVCVICKGVGRSGGMLASPLESTDTAHPIQDPPAGLLDPMRPS